MIDNLPTIEELADEAPLHEVVAFELQTAIDDIINGELYHAISRGEVHSWIVDLENILTLKGEK